MLSAISWASFSAYRRRVSLKSPVLLPITTSQRSICCAAAGTASIIASATTSQRSISAPLVEHERRQVTARRTLRRLARPARRARRGRSFVLALHQIEHLATSRFIERHCPVEQDSAASREVHRGG